MKYIRTHMYQADRSVTMERMELHGRSLQMPKEMKAWLLDPRSNIRRCGRRYIAVLSAMSWRPRAFGSLNPEYGDAALFFDRETRIEEKAHRSMRLMADIPGPLMWAILVGMIALVFLGVVVANKMDFISFDQFTGTIKGVLNRD